MTRQHGIAPTIARPSCHACSVRLCRLAFTVLAALTPISIPAGLAQDAATQFSDPVVIHGTVLNSDGKAVSDAVVRVTHEGTESAVETRTDAAGFFCFSARHNGRYTISAEKSRLRSKAAAIDASSSESGKQLVLVLEDAAAILPNFPAAQSSSVEPMEFSDKVSFSVAGVTDWTAVGGHGSDSSLRTSEDLARETIALQPATSGPGAIGSIGNGREGNQSESELRASLASTPSSFKANQLLGEFYLQAGRYRDAVPPLQRAFQIDPSNHQNEYELALALKDAGDLSQAQKLAHKLLAHKQNANSFRLAGSIDERLGDSLAAVHEFEQAVRLDPSEPNVFEWGFGTASPPGCVASPRGL